MKSLKIAAALVLLTGLAVAQELTRESVLVEKSISGHDLLSTMQSVRDLGMFVAAAQSSGMAKMLREPGALTVFALSDRAFVNLPKADRETLLTSHAAMNILLAHYIAHGNIPTEDTADLQSARTLIGVKLHTDFRPDATYINGAKLSSAETRCSNGTLHILDSFDPILVHEALAIAKPRK